MRSVAAEPFVRKIPFRVRFRKSLPVYALLLPGVLLLIFFHYVPIFGIIIGFDDFSPYKGILASPWVGVKHFVRFLTDPNFWRVMRNTIVINLYQLLFGFPFPIIFALFLNELWSSKSKKAIQTISYLPHFLSWVIVASLFRNMLSPSQGIINGLIEFLGGEPIYFLTKTRYFRTIIVIQSVWKGFGMSAVYYIASLSSIDTQLYEAAAIDGAGRLRQTWHITLPGLRNIIIVLLVLQMGSMITIGFEQIYLMYNDPVYAVGDVISTYVYRLGIESTQFSYTAAIGVTQNIVNFLLVYSANKLSRSIAGWSLW